MKDGWLGLTFSPDGKIVYVGGGSQAAVFEFAFARRKAHARAYIHDRPRGQAYSHRFHRRCRSLSRRTSLYAAGLFHDAIHVINLAVRTRNRETSPPAGGPIASCFIPTGSRTSFRAGRMARSTTTKRKQGSGSASSGWASIRLIWCGARESQTDERGSKSRWTARLFVAAANTNNVYSVGVIREQRSADDGDHQCLYDGASAARHDADGACDERRRESSLFVVCSDANAVAVVDISEENSVPSSASFRPAGIRPPFASLAGQCLVVFNGRGLRSFPNPQGPNPPKRPAPAHLGTARRSSTSGVCRRAPPP